MRFIFRILILLIGAYAVLSIVRGIFGSATKKQANIRRSYSAGHLVKDPVCGTYVPANSAIEAKGEFFCSEECRGKFLTT